MAFARGQQTTIDPFRSSQPLDVRVAHAWQTIETTVGGDWRQAMMFAGEAVPLPAGA